MNAGILLHVFLIFCFLCVGVKSQLDYIQQGLPGIHIISFFFFFMM